MEMNTINTKHVMLYGGTETTAPMALVSGGEVAPSWAGKTLRELDNAQFDAMFAFALADGRAKGFEAGTKHRRVSGNPFHKSYLHGAPAMYFRTGYRLVSEAG